MLIGASEIAAMTPAQKAAYDAIASGPRKGVPLPFLAMLDAPDLAGAIQTVGASIRFSGRLSPEHRELAILATAAAFGSGYEWDYHLPIARRLGLGEVEIAAAFRGEATGDLGPAAAAIVATCREAVLERRVGADRLEKLVAAVGRDGATEVVAIAGYYNLLALFLSAGGLDHSCEPAPA